MIACKGFQTRWFVTFVIATMVVIWVIILYGALHHAQIQGQRLTTGQNAVDVKHNAEEVVRNAKEIHSFKYLPAEYKKLVGGMAYSAPVPTEVKPPPYFKLGDLLAQWNPDDTSPQRWIESPAHPNKGAGMPRFDYSDPVQRALALQYREAELPFISYNIPELDRAILETFSLENLQKRFKHETIDVEAVASNNYLFYHGKESKIRNNPGWKAPQTDLEMKFEDFLEKMVETERRPDFVNSSLPTWYFTLAAKEVR
jgi:hypothetical protein